MEFENIIYTIKDNIATIRINRPKVYNALNSALTKEFLEVLRLIVVDESIRVLIITGNEKAFAAGADISEMVKATPNFARNFCSEAVNLNNILESISIPTIAAVNGLAWGGGFEMALACDFRIGGPHTSFKLPEVSLGIIPGANGTQRLLTMLSSTKVKEITMLCSEIKGPEAYELGLINRYVEDSMIYYEAIKMADELKRHPSCALKAAKTAISVGTFKTIEEGKAVEINEFALLFDTYDQKEGMTAFIEKRKVKFKNR